MDPGWKEAASAAMHRYAGGDDSAFDGLYDLLKPPLERFLLRRARTGDRAEELLQETFLAMVRARGHFARGASVAPWAYAIARRLVIDDVRRHARSAKMMDEKVEPEANAGSPEAAADEALALRRLVRAVERELSRVPEAQREVFELVQLEGLSIAETAEVLGTTEMAVRLRLHRAHQALRARLGDEFREIFEGGKPGQREGRVRPCVVGGLSPLNSSSGSTLGSAPRNARYMGAISWV